MKSRSLNNLRKNDLIKLSSYKSWAKFNWQFQGHLFLGIEQNIQERPFMINDNERFNLLTTEMDLFGSSWLLTLFQNRIKLFLGV